jgi:hypothetical protein
LRSLYYLICRSYQIEYNTKSMGNANNAAGGSAHELCVFIKRLLKDTLLTQSTADELSFIELFALILRELPESILSFIESNIKTIEHQVWWKMAYLNYS